MSTRKFHHQLAPFRAAAERNRRPSVLAWCGLRDDAARMPPRQKSFPTGFVSRARSPPPRRAEYPRPAPRRRRDLPPRNTSVPGRGGAAIARTICGRGDVAPAGAVAGETYIVRVVLTGGGGGTGSTNLSTDSKGTICDLKGNVVAEGTTNMARLTVLNERRKKQNPNETFDYPYLWCQGPGGVDPATLDA